jgi:Na+-transporting NADH:ubiquinone oxidoreductase subunit C
VDGTAYIAVVQAGPGLWGTITAIVSSDAAVARLRGLEILSQNETPGLGGRVDEAWFKAQFKGELVGTLGVTVNPAGPGDADHENARVDAITGASRTSQGIQAILDASLGRLRKIGGGRR